MRTLDRANCSVGDRVTYSPTCHGQIVRVLPGGQYIIRLDSGSTITAGAGTVRVGWRARLATWVGR